MFMQVMCIRYFLSSEFLIDKPQKNATKSLKSLQFPHLNNLAIICMSREISPMIQTDGVKGCKNLASQWNEKGFFFRNAIFLQVPVFFAVFQTTSDILAFGHLFIYIQYLSRSIQLSRASLNGSIPHNISFASHLKFGQGV